VISIDGELVDADHAVISVLDRGLLFGDGCFEVLRTWAGVPVELGAHLDRLLDTAEVLALRGVARGAIEAAVHAALGAADAAMPGEHRIRIVLTRGPGELAAPISSLGPGRTLVIIEPLGPQPTEISLAIVDLPLPRRRGRGHKTLAYLDHVLARELARAHGADEGVRLDDAGHVMECATSNIFVVSRGAVVTPATHGGVLPGIVRARVLALCGAQGIETRIGQLTVSELRAADEIFITSSLRGVVPVTRLDGELRPAGPLSVRIASGYAHQMATVR
jgi:branched-chain amino acid aminotransferase